MHLELTTDQADELKALLATTLGDLSYEIAATDNAVYRAGLMARRTRYTEVFELVSRELAVSASDGAVPGPGAVMRELAHPGD